MRRGDAYAYTDVYAYCYVYAYSNVYAYSYGNIYADSYGNIYADSYRNVYAYTNGYGYLYTNTNTNADSDADITGTGESDHSDRNDLYTVRERHGRDPQPADLQRSRREDQTKRHARCVLLLGVCDG
jgi:hypothetical protein